MLLAGRLVDSQQFSDANIPLYRFQQTPAGPIPNAAALNVNYQENFEVDTVELNQIFQTERVTLLRRRPLSIWRIPDPERTHQPERRGPIFLLPPLPINSFSAQLVRTRDRLFLPHGQAVGDNLWLTGRVCRGQRNLPERLPPAAHRGGRRNTRATRPEGSPRMEPEFGGNVARYLYAFARRRQPR